MLSGSGAIETILLVWPRRVMMAVVVEEARGSISVICRAELPVARIWEEEREGREEMERSGCEVVRVSTTVDVSRSRVFTVWSKDVE